MPLTFEQIANRVSKRTEALIEFDYPRPQCANKQAAWQKDIAIIKKMVVEKLVNSGVKIGIEIK